MMGDMMGFGRRGMKEGMGHGTMMHSVPMMEGRLAYIKADLEIADTQLAPWDAYANAVRTRHATMEGMRAEINESQTEWQRFVAPRCPHQSPGEQARQPQGAQARDGGPLRRP